MAAPTDTGLVENVELDKGLGLSADDPIGFDEKNGGEDEEVQVAKKPRVEKAENGDAAAGEFGVDDGEELAKKDATPDLEALNGNESEERLNGEGEDEDSVGAVAEDADDVEPAAVEDTEPVTTGKDASSGDVGLRTLLQEGDTTKPSVVNGTEDASHLLNGAK